MKMGEFVLDDLCFSNDIGACLPIRLIKEKKETRIEGKGMGRKWVKKAKGIKRYKSIYKISHRDIIYSIGI